MSKSKSKPIIFSSEMVRALLDGRKSQTRRIIPEKILDKYSNYDDYCNSVMPADIPCTREYEKAFFLKESRFNVGDKLWVRESFYDRVDYAVINMLRSDRFVFLADGKQSGWKLHPAIYMPKIAARIWLEVTGVRVERLQDISTRDILKEGYKSQPIAECIKKEYVDIIANLPVERKQFALWTLPKDAFIETNYPKPREWYKALFESINGEDGWDENPWVWVIEFKRIQPAEVVA